MTTFDPDRIAFEWFASAHPHEAYALHPDKFWEFFHNQCPGITREQMEALLKSTDGKPNTP